MDGGLVRWENPTITGGFSNLCFLYFSMWPKKIKGCTQKMRYPKISWLQESQCVRMQMTICCKRIHTYPHVWHIFGATTKMLQPSSHVEFKYRKGNMVADSVVDCISENKNLCYLAIWSFMEKRIISIPKSKCLFTDHHTQLWVKPPKKYRFSRRNSPILWPPHPSTMCDRTVTLGWAVWPFFPTFFQRTWKQVSTWAK